MICPSNFDLRILISDRSAQNEALTALDFISLLLSKDAPKQAEMTMSPYLKTHIKPGTLAMDAWHNMEPDKELQTTDDTIARGWRMQSLQASADSLLGAATRLEKDVRRETKYWEQVLSVSEKGWSISRMPRERHNLGVRYGFLEALGEFRERGLAALRADEAGNVVLDRGFGNNPKAIQVRIQQGDETIGKSRLTPMADESETTLEARIRHARDSLYEEELFHEMTGESRTLASYGVVMHGSSIYLPTRLSADETLTDSKRSEIIIDLVSLDEADGQSNVHPSQDRWAQAIALTFRLLLSNTHRDRLERRSQLPPPLSTAKRESPVASIMRPVLKLVQHRSLLEDIDSYLGRLKETLQRGSIDISTKPVIFDAALLSQTKSVDSFMESVMAPLRSRCSFSLNVPSQDEPIEFHIDVHTAMTAPLFGSNITVPSPLGSQVVDMSDMKELIDYVDTVVAGALARGIADMMQGWTFHERSASLSKVGSSEKVAVEVLSGGITSDEASEACVLLMAGGKTNRWSLNIDQPERDFWGTVQELGK